MAVEEKVTPEEILHSEGAAEPVTEGTFLQRTGLVLATAVGALASLVILALLGRWIFYAPSAPVIPAGTDPATTKIILDNFKSLQQIALEPFTALFDSIVVKVLLPVFTSILGYIFGSRTAEKQT
jgi:hypothetical protein